MANQIVVSAGAKVRNLDGVLTGTSGVVNSLPINASNGIPQLDVNGKILVSQLPNSVMEYKGTWNAATNTPTLANGTGNQGDVYLCNVAGTVDFGAGPIAFVVGDQVIYSGSIWQRASGATGTVTSVAITESGDSLNITGSPITTSGTINIGFNGTNLQYVNGAGNLTTFPDLTGYVPYSGATANVNLGEYGLSGGFIGFDTTPTSTPTAQGTMYWNADKESVDVIMNGVTGSVMQDTFYNVKNQTGATITKGTIVRANGTVGASGRILIAPFLADGSYDSKVCLGVTAETILNGEDGKVTAFGAIRQIDTSAFANGTILYASPTTAGGFTSTEPTNPNNIVTIAIVVYSDVNNGEILVRPTFVDNAIDIAASLGYTPANDALVVHLAGTETITGAKTFTATSLTLAPTSGGGTLNLKQDSFLGATNGYTSLTSSGSDFAIIAATGVSTSKQAVFSLSSLGSTLRTYTLPNATGTLALTSDLTGGTVTSVAALTIGTTGTDLSSSVANSTTTPVITLNVPTASATNRGALSSTDWTTFNNKQSALTNPVTGTGTTNYLPKFTGTSTIGNSAFYDGGGFGGFNSVGLGSRTFVIQAANARPLALEMIENANVHAVYVRPNNSGYNLISSNYISGGVYIPLALSGRESSSDLVLWTNGNTSIGQSSDSGYKLDVNGTGRFAASYTASGTVAIETWQRSGGAVSADMTYNDANTSMNFGTSTSHTLNIKTNNTTALSLASTGAATFSSSVTAGTGQGFMNLSYQAGYNRIWSFGSGSEAYGMGYYQGASAPGGSDCIGFHFGSTASPLFYANNYGNATFSSSVTAGGGNFVVHSNGNASIGNPTQIGTLYIAGDTTIATNANISSNGGYMTLQKAGGSVLIGTTADEGYKLYVNGGSSSGMLFYSTSAANQIKAAGTAPAITFSNTITSPTIGGSLGACTSAGQFLSGTAAGDMILINQFTGNKLYITNYSGGVYLTQGATSWTANSDIRLKNINGHIENAVEKLSTLQTINFSYKDDKTNKQNLGLIAQEVEKIFPELIDKNGDGMLGVRYTELVPVLIKAIQEQQKEINELKLKIK